ncbi:DUF4405 domain-containing protein [Desulfogranum mediterraneum]|uniref:DUF4405 domain-containing protein n=1 Tax=Desulfogranum mediterraneum TaxID=160661 RepID=UPI00041F3369|nr:DUF4405 domain-containing protein [Desulfogranum mediterraneum]
MSVRNITSLTLLLSFLLLTLTSIVLYIVPEGRVAYWSDWRMMGLSKSQWGDIHINLGFLFLAALLLHLYYNWKPLMAYMKNRARELKIFTPDFTIALLLTAAFTVGTLLMVPPFSTILDFGSSFKDAAADRYGEPPYGHAELSSLKMLAKRTGLELETIRTQLTAAQIRFTDESQTLLAIAQANQLTPKALFDIIKPMPAKVETGASQPFPELPFPGLGRKVLKDLCQEYGLDLEKVSAALEAKGVQADPGQTLKEIGAANDTDPHALFEILHGVAVTP